MSASAIPTARIATHARVHHIERLAHGLGVSTESLNRLFVGRDCEAFTFPMRDATARVVGIRRSGDAYLAAFDAEAERRNVRVDLELETADAGRVVVSQITGLIARRIVCHPKVGEWLRRGERFGLIRFGSRTDVLLPAAAEPMVAKGDRVRGGESVLARLPSAESHE